MDVRANPTDGSGCRLRHVDLRVAVTVAAVVNALLGLALFTAGAIVLVVAAGHGLLDQLNEVTRDLGGGQGLSIPRLLVVWALIVTGWSAALTVVAGLATVVLNQVLDAVGGIELELGAAPVDDDGGRRLGRWRAAANARLQQALAPRQTA